MNNTVQKDFFYPITEDIAINLKDYLSKYFSDSSSVWLDSNVVLFLKPSKQDDNESNVSIPEIIHFINSIIAVANNEYETSSLHHQTLDDIRNAIFDIFTNCNFNYVMNGYHKYVEDLKLNKIENYVAPEKEHGWHLSPRDLLHMDKQDIPQDVFNAVFDSKLFTAILEFGNLTGLWDYRFDIAVDSELQKQISNKLEMKI